MIVENLRANLADKVIEGLFGEESLSRNEIAAITDVFTPLTSVLGPKQHADYYDRKLLQHSGYPRSGPNWENYKYPTAETPYEAAHNAVLGQLEAEAGVDKFAGIDVHYAEGLAGAAVASLRLWSTINQHRPCILQADTLEKIAIEAAVRFAVPSEIQNVTARLAEMVMPDLRQHSWREIVRLKKQGAFAVLKAKIAEASRLSENNLTTAEQLFAEYEAEAQAAVFERGRPRPLRATFETIAVNLPIPILPFLWDAIELVKEFGARDELGWYYLLSDLRQQS